MASCAFTTLCMCVYIYIYIYIHLLVLYDYTSLAISVYYDVLIIRTSIPRASGFDPIGILSR